MIGFWKLQLFFTCCSKSLVAAKSLLRCVMTFQESVRNEEDSVLKTSGHSPSVASDRKREAKDLVSSHSLRSIQVV